MKTEVSFSYETDFALNDEVRTASWLIRAAAREGFQVEELTYIFCTDEYLLDINRKYLHHNTFTDIITFDYVEGKRVSGDIFISVDRIKENAALYDVSFIQELMRVMAHGLLHLMTYTDKSKEENLVMRRKEDELIQLFHVEH